MIPITILILLYACGCIITVAFIDVVDDNVPAPRWLRRVLIAVWPLFALVLVAMLAFLDPRGRTR